MGWSRGKGVLEKKVLLMVFARATLSTDKIFWIPLESTANVLSLDITFSKGAFFSAVVFLTEFRPTYRAPSHWQLTACQHRWRFLCETFCADALVCWYVFRLISWLCRILCQFLLVAFERYRYFQFCLRWAELANVTGSGFLRSQKRFGVFDSGWGQWRPRYGPMHFCVASLGNRVDERAQICTVLMDVVLQTCY